MKGFLKYIGAAAIAVSLSGCSDYLDVNDDSSINPGNFPTNLNHVDLMLNSAYAGSHSIGLYAYYWYPMVMYLLDKTMDCYGDYDSRTMILANNANVSCPYLSRSYGNIMDWIQLSNAAIEAVDNYRPSAAESEYAQLDYMKGQALFLRGLAYWHSQIFFELESKEGALGFPIIEKVPQGISEMTPPRATAAETWQFIIDTFKEAADLLEGQNKDKTRATEWAAKAMLAKSYVQARRPQEAVPVLEDIFAHSGARLLDYATYSESFYANELHEFNIETLYEIDMTMNSKQNGPWAGYTTGSGMQMVMAPWPLNLDFRWKSAPEAGKELETQSTGGWGNNFVHDGSVRRFGFPLDIPGSRVVNPNAGKRTPYNIDNFPWILDPAYAARSREVRDNKECDPRLFICAGQPYFDTFKDARGRVTYYDRSPEATGLGYDSHYYFSPRKFTNTDGIESALNFSSGANLPVVRLADLYLLYAECIKDTNPSTALEYVNKVHRRAYGANPDVASPYDYTSLTSTTCAATWEPTDVLAKDVIKYERWAELFGEGQWWYDVRRYEILENEMKVYKNTRYGKLQYLGERCYAQPIPLTEIERYNGNLPQNYNY